VIKPGLWGHRWRLDHAVDRPRAHRHCQAPVL